MRPPEFKMLDQLATRLDVCDCAYCDSAREAIQEAARELEKAKDALARAFRASDMARAFVQDALEVHREKNLASARTRDVA